MIVSCSASAPDYGPAADAMCECMEEKDAERGDDSLIGANLDYALCAFDVILDTGTDINNADFGKALAEKCDKYNELHDEYLKTIEDNDF